MVVSEFDSVSPLYRTKYVLRGQKRRLWFMVLLIAIVLGVFGLISVSGRVAANSSQVPAVAATPVQTPVTPPAPATPAATAPVVTTAVHTMPPQRCTPDTAYASPAQLNLTSATDGLTQVIDSPAYYQIYGNTASQVDTEVKQCAPSGGSGTSAGGEFAAETGYSVAWQYTAAPDDTGSCSLTDVKVGLHINMVLPQWQTSVSAAHGLASSWQAFASNLVVHENGHVAIDQQAAAQLLTDLQSYPATDCGTISAGVQAKVTADLAAITAANNAYDARTNHGATQGAILP